MDENIHWHNCVFKSTTVKNNNKKLIQKKKNSPVPDRNQRTKTQYLKINSSGFTLLASPDGSNLFLFPEDLLTFSHIYRTTCSSQKATWKAAVRQDICKCAMKQKRLNHSQRLQLKGWTSLILSGCSFDVNISKQRQGSKMEGLQRDVWDLSASDCWTFFSLWLISHTGGFKLWHSAQTENN